MTTHTTLRRAALGLAVLALLATGCGDDDDGDDAAPDSTAGASESSAPECALTVEDVSAALGETMVAVDTPPCSFERAELPDTGPSISYRPSPPAVIAQFGAGGSDPVDVGDEAYFEEGSGNLAVRQGDVAFQIQLLIFDGDVKATVIGLAEGVLAAS